MSRLEFLSPEGLRLDGRRANELRSMSARMGVLQQVDGSALFELGNTRILATIHGPHEVQEYLFLLTLSHAKRVKFNMIESL